MSFRPGCHRDSESDLTDVNFALDTLDSTLFPGVSSDVEVHNGFAAEHAKTAATILTEVKSLMSEHSATKVTLVSSMSTVHSHSSNTNTDTFKRSDTHSVAHWRNLMRCSCH